MAANFRRTVIHHAAEVVRHEGVPPVRDVAATRISAKLP